MKAGHLPSSPEDWLNIVLAPFQDLHMRVLLEFDGTVDAARLSRAVWLSLEAEPILGCRFVSGAWRARWERRGDLRPEDLCRLVPSSDVRGDLAAFMAGHQRPWRDPLVQVRIFRSAADTVCVKLCHGAGDGIAVKEYLALLAGIYRRLAADPSYVPRPDPRADRGQAQVLRQFPSRKKFWAVCTQTLRRDPWSFPYASTSRADPAFAERTLLPEDFAAVRASARRKGVSVNDVLVAAFLRAMFETADPKPGIPLSVFIPVDLRRYLPAKRTFAYCNLFSYLILDLPRRPGVPFDRTLTEVHRFLEAQKTRNPGLGFAAFLQTIAGAGFGVFDFASTIRVWQSKLTGHAYPTISNLGVFDPDVADFGAVRARSVRLFSPVAYPPTFTIVAGTFGGALTLTCSYCAGAVRDNAVEECLDRMVREIRGMIA